LDKNEDEFWVESGCDDDIKKGANRGAIFTLEPDPQNTTTLSLDGLSWSDRHDRLFIFADIWEGNSGRPVRLI
jgi:hypothetical protein